MYRQCVQHCVCGWLRVVSAWCDNSSMDGAALYFVLSGRIDCVKTCLTAPGLLALSSWKPNYCFFSFLLFVKKQKLTLVVPFYAPATSPALSPGGCACPHDWLLRYRQDTFVQANYTCRVPPPRLGTIVYTAAHLSHMPAPYFWFRPPAMARSGT
jgi:hypothetical protein